MSAVPIPKVFIGLSLVIGVAIATCQHGSNAPIFKKTLTVSAASSLQDALRPLEMQFEQRYPNLDLIINLGSSGALQRQIEQGAPVDLFISAAPEQMTALAQQQLILADTRQGMATNRLVLIVPWPNRLSIKSFQQLTDPRVQRIMVGEFNTVPAGQYAQEVLKSLNLFTGVQAKLIFANTARGVLAAVAGDNADAGIVYATDTQSSAQVQVVAVAPAHSHAPIVYEMAVLTDTDHPQEAKRLADFLRTSAAQETLRKFGFGSAPRS